MTVGLLRAVPMRPAVGPRAVLGWTSLVRRRAGRRPAALRTLVEEFARHLLDGVHAAGRPTARQRLVVCASKRSRRSTASAKALGGLRALTDLQPSRGRSQRVLIAQKVALRGLRRRTALTNVRLDARVPQCSLGSKVRAVAGEQFADAGHGHAPARKSSHSQRSRRALRSRRGPRGGRGGDGGVRLRLEERRRASFRAERPHRAHACRVRVSNCRRGAALRQERAGPETKARGSPRLRGAVAASRVGVATGCQPSRRPMFASDRRVNSHVCLSGRRVERATAPRLAASFFF